MIITNVSYRKNFSVSQFIFEHIGLDAQLEPHENPAEVLASLKKQVEELHRQNNPHLYQEDKTVHAKQDESIPITQRYENARNVYHQSKPLADQIRACTELEGQTGLYSFKLLIQNDNEAKKAYLEMLEKLSKVNA